MTRAFSVVAPGKVVLLGDYAVLDGAPALVAAVSSGVRCEVAVGGPEVVVHAPGDDRFVREALAAAGAPPGTYRFGAHRPPPTGSKPGLGGSAAATVAAVIAAWEASGRTIAPAGVHRLAHRVHARVQGSGSGIDVAASTYGGVLRFRAGVVEPAPPVDPVVVWSGGSASTGPRVERYLALADRGRFARESAGLVDRCAADPVLAFREARALLTDMAARAGIPYWTDALARACDLAEACGGGAKPSGAGGGDCAVAVFRDRADAERYRARCAAEALQVLDVAVAPGAGVVS